MVDPPVAIMAPPRGSSISESLGSHLVYSGSKNSDKRDSGVEEGFIFCGGIFLTFFL